MTEKRFNFNLTLGEDEHKGLIFDNGKIMKTRDVVYLLNKLLKVNEQLKKSIKRQQLSNEECSKYMEMVVKENVQLKSTNMEMEDYFGGLEKQIILLMDQLNYIQNLITDKIKHQKTKIGEKVLKEIIENYNEWILGHKEIVKMNENKRYIYDIHRIFDNEKQFACADTMDDAEIIVDRLNLQEENIILLQERNDRQYNQLTHLWTCIKNKDYETLQKELKEMEEAEKTLQTEMTCYNLIGDDVE